VCLCKFIANLHFHHAPRTTGYVMRVPFLS
jgi:hypothetical protein